MPAGMPIRHATSSASVAGLIAGDPITPGALCRDARSRARRGPACGRGAPPGQPRLTHDRLAFTSAQKKSTGWRPAPVAPPLPIARHGGMPMKISNLLFATDFSETATGARSLAALMAAEKGARLHLVHVVPNLMDPAPATALLQSEARAVAQSGAVIETALLRGSAAAAIVRYARANAIDMIVIGTHGRTGLSRVLLGSVAEAVLRLAPCPVLAVPLARAAADPGEAPATSPAAEAPPLPYCISCATPSEDLICAACRDRIRGEAVAAKRSLEKAGRRGQPA